MYGFFQENYQIQKTLNEEHLIGYGFWIFTHTENGLVYKASMKFSS